MQHIEAQDAPRTPPLDPIDRLSEIMFGLFMALTFTGTASVTLGEGGTVRGILLAAIGCNIAWGIVDAVVYTLGTVAARRRRAAGVARILSAPVPEARARLRAALPHGAGGALGDADADRLVGLLRSQPQDRSLAQGDLRAAAVIFFVIVAATWPPIVPFLLTEDVTLAMRLSNGIAVLMLVAIGWRLDVEIADGRRIMRWLIPVIGAAMVAITIALGG